MFDDPNATADGPGAKITAEELLARKPLSVLLEKLRGWGKDRDSKRNHIENPHYRVIADLLLLQAADRQQYLEYMESLKPFLSGILLDKLVAEATIAVARPRGAFSKDLPSVIVRSGNLSRICDEMEENLINGGFPIYQRGNKLVTTKPVETVTYHGKEYTTNIVPLSAAGLREMVARAMMWEKPLKGKEGEPEEFKSIDPPQIYPNSYIAQDRSWRVHQINGIFPTPTFRPDGSLLNVPGYDFATNACLVNDPTIGRVEVEKKPNKDTAIKMRDVLLEYLTEFKFIDKGAPGGVGDGAISRAVALSMIISLVARGILGQVPMHSVVAPTPGSGKSYLADIAAYIALGIPCPVISLGKSEEEYVKVLTSHVVAGVPLICNDNVNDELGSDLLGQIIERPLVSVRPFGRNDTILQIAYRGLVFANGNNMMVRGDMVRRTVTAFLDTKAERPELIEYRCDPKSMILKDRAKPIIAALTMARAYIEAGTPGALPVLNSFAEWSNLVRSMLVWLGEADVCSRWKRLVMLIPCLGICVM